MSNDGFPQHKCYKILFLSVVNTYSLVIISSSPSILNKLSGKWTQWTSPWPNKNGSKQRDFGAILLPSDFFHCNNYMIETYRLNIVRTFSSSLYLEAFEKVRPNKTAQKFYGLHTNSSGKVFQVFDFLYLSIEISTHSFTLCTLHSFTFGLLKWTL